MDSKVASSIVEELKLGLQIMLDKQVEFIEEERLEKDRIPVPCTQTRGLDERDKENEV